MFDLRYHVASLAAVFLALIIGILVGVGIADRGYLDKGTRGLLERRVAELQKKLDQTTQQAGNRTPLGRTSTRPIRCSFGTGSAASAWRLSSWAPSTAAFARL
jgi:hypothetical protein